MRCEVRSTSQSSQTESRRDDSLCCKLHARRKRPRAHVPHDTSFDMHGMYDLRYDGIMRNVNFFSQCACATGLRLLRSIIGHFAYMLLSKIIVHCTFRARVTKNYVFTKIKNIILLQTPNFLAELKTKLNEFWTANYIFYLPIKNKCSFVWKCWIFVFYGSQWYNVY